MVISIFEGPEMAPTNVPMALPWAMIFISVGEMK